MAQKKRTISRRPELSVGRSTASTSTGANERASRWVCLALVVLAVLPYLQILNHDFVNFDDGAYVTENPLVQQGLNWSGVEWAFTTMQTGNWLPLTWLSYMLDCQLHGLQPGWHHLTNVLIHAANTALLFVVLRSMTGMMWRSALVAALFAVHPLHVESVAWIAERKDVLSTFFGLWAIWAYIRYARGPSLLRYGLVAFFFALSLLSKPMLVTLPFVLLLLDVWPLRRCWSENGARNQPFASLFLEKLPLLAMSAILSVVTFKAQHAAGAVAPIETLSLSQRFANSIVAYADYLGKAFWPVDLAVIYPLRTKISVTEMAVAIVVMVGITIGVGLLTRKRQWLAVGWLWFLGTLVPVIGLVQVGDQSMADRYTYVPLIGVFVMIAWSIPTTAFATSARSQISATVAGLILVALSAVTFMHLKVWKNTTTLFENAVRVTEGNYVAHNLFAGALGAEGDLVGAREHIEKALQLKPDYAGAHYNRGLVFLRGRDFVSAEQEFRLALKTLDRDPMIWNGLGVACISLGRTDEAIANYRKSLELNPYYADAFLDLGAALLSKGNFAEAVEASEKSIRLRPGVAEAYSTLGAAFWNLGRSDESILNNRKAVELSPTLVSARVNLGVALLAKGLYDEAMANAESALRLDPQNELAQKILNAARSKRDGAVNQP